MDPLPRQTARKSSSSTWVCLPKNNSKSSLRESSIDSSSTEPGPSDFPPQTTPDKVTRELNLLAFQNPGRYNAEFPAARSKRREYSENKKRNVDSRPQYDGKGQLTYDGHTFPRICDCFNENCPGCFPSCKKCSSRMCGVICQLNRKVIFFKNQEQGAGGSVVRNPQISNSLMSKLESSLYSGSEDDETDSD
uniref:ARF7 effector protein C-terminal domain-containing protein n=1 Tax=Panagrolaimus sp. JU765 TaxID=591449 RepID=A0AC34RE88_9BILA